MVVKMESKFIGRVCIDYETKCVNVAMYSFEGKCVYSKQYCGIELIDIKGIAKILIADKIFKDTICITVETSNIKIMQTNSVLEIH